MVISSLNPGGAERVISRIANYLQETGLYQVYLVVLTKQPHFYEINKDIKFFEPDFTIDSMSRLKFQWLNFCWLRSVLKGINTSQILVFSGKYISFVLLASLFLRKQVFISEREKPDASYGIALDVVNRFVYWLAAGIICQTSVAEKIMRSRYPGKKTVVVPNPIARPIFNNSKGREKIILNVGRFIESKNQSTLIDIFDQIEAPGWRLVFLGDGPQGEILEAKAATKQKADQIFFLGNVKEIEDYFSKSAVFAFTSLSEGFPNVLGEAMAYGCACISFDCPAGPADLIDDGENGFLVALGDVERYKLLLSKLIQEESLRSQFSICAHERMKSLEETRIVEMFVNFIFAVKS